VPHHRKSVLVHAIALFAADEMHNREHDRGPTCSLCSRAEEEWSCH
jgi:hypothetical protein